VSREDYAIPDFAPEPPEDTPERAAGRGTSLAQLSPSDGLPSSPHTEVVVLGAMLGQPEAIQQAFGMLEAEDFSLDSHQRIFRAIKAVTEKYELTEKEDITVLVRAEIDRRRELDTIGGFAYLLYLTEGVPRGLNIESYAQIVKDKSLLRQLLSIFDEGMRRTIDPDEQGINIATDIVSLVSEVVESNQIKTEVFDSPTLERDATDRLLDNPIQQPAIATGIPSLDMFTSGGMRLGEIWVIGASPSRGKTTLARQIVKNVIQNQGIAAYVHSGEMTKESWYDVTACLLVGMPAWKIREPWLLNSPEKDALRAGLRELGKLPLHISDAGGINIDKLLWNASRAVRQHGIQLLVVDYAQIINAPGKDERQKVTNVAQKLRVFSKDENVATILLSQSPRPEGRNINSRPNMFSLKESGALEEAAHTVILPFRPVDPETNSFTGDDELVIGKQRWGSIGSIPVHLDGKYLHFAERNNNVQ
jgi:replicative DNA helicase